jgi:tetratricopeptide (TPR) repeat protein
VRLIICFPGISLSFEGYSQSVEDSYKIAENQFLAGNYEMASFYYQRILCFGITEEQNLCYCNLAECYLKQSDFTRAIEYFELAWSTSTNDSVRNEIKFRKALVLLSSNKYQLALIELLDAPEFVSPSFQKRRVIYLGFTYFLLANFQKADSCFRRICIENCPQKLSDYEQIMSENRKINKLSIKKARWLSTFIPGSGQMYVGDTRNAVNSALLNLSLLSLAVLVGYNYGVIDAFVAVFPWFFRYYTGGIKKVETIAGQKIYLRRQVIYDDLIRFIRDCE